VITELRRQSGEPDVDVVALHLDGLGRPRLRVTQDDTGDAAILAEARIYSDAGALAEVIEGQPLPPPRSRPAPWSTSPRTGLAASAAPTRSAASSSPATRTAARPRRPSARS
jgi:hypothetical protein